MLREAKFASRINVDLILFHINYPEAAQSDDLPNVSGRDSERGGNSNVNSNELININRNFEK